MLETAFYVNHSKVTKRSSNILLVLSKEEKNILKFVYNFTPFIKRIKKYNGFNIRAFATTAAGGTQLESPRSKISLGIERSNPLLSFVKINHTQKLYTLSLPHTYTHTPSHTP